MRFLPTNLLLAALCVFALARDAGAVIKLPRVLSSHMVLQRDLPVPIWGTADPHEKVTVTFRDQSKTTLADDQGKWMLKLDPLKVGDATPATLTVTGTNTITLTDVLVGEVWVGSGQSNIDSPVNMYIGQDAALKDAKGKTYPQLRLYHSVLGNGWREANNPDLIGGYSAQLFYFGVLLQKQLNIPVGVMEGAVAGSPSSPFLPQDAFNTDRAIQAILTKYDAGHPLDVLQKKYEESLAKWNADVAAELASAAPSSPPPPAQSPGAASSPSPASPSSAPGAASPGPTGSIPPAILAKHPKPKPPTLAVDIKTGDSFEKHIRPMIPYAIRGVLWDQGEGGSGAASYAGVWQSYIMAALIPSWRKLWGEGDFPWLYVQKPSGGGCALNPADPVNAGASPFVPLPKDVPSSDYFSGLHREALEVIAQNPATYLVITTDLGTGVHPVNKSGYAARDLRLALGAVYGQPIEYYGPKFASFAVEGNKIRLSYTHLGKGLTVPAGQPLQGFCLAGEDKKFHWANAVIDGQTVVLSSPDVPLPVAARYAWTWPLAWANLFNAEGLPAIGFRTDTW